MDELSISIPGLTFSKLRSFRAFLFPSCLADPSHKPHFSFEKKAQWVTSPAAAFFLQEMEGSNTSEEDDMPVDTESLIDAQPLEVIEKYRAFILPPAMASNSFFSLDNAPIWILQCPFQLFINNLHILAPHNINPTVINPIEHTTPIVKKEPTAVALGKRKARPLANDTEVIEISDDSDTGLDNKLTKSQKKSSAIPSIRQQLTKRIKSEPGVKSEPYNSDFEDIIDLTVATATHRSLPASSRKGTTDTGSGKTPTLSKPKSKTTKSTTKPHSSGNHSKAGKSSHTKPTPKDLIKQWYPNFNTNSSAAIRFTQKDAVEAVADLSEIPSGWDVRSKLTAFILDLTNSDQFVESERSKSIISWIRHEDQCSWGGSGGKRDGDVDVKDLLGEGKIRARRAVLECNGIKICEHLNRNLLEDFEGWEIDSAEMRPFWSLELSANEEAYLDPQGPLSRFYLRAMNSKCKFPDCHGKPIIRTLKQPTRFNKTSFIGCSQWRAGDKGHRCIQIEQDIDEKLLTELFKNGGKLESKPSTSGHEKGDKVQAGECCVVVHPRSHRETCGFTHTVDGSIQQGKIIPYEHRCPSRLLIFEPVDSTIRKALVIPKFPHNHPRHAHVKPTFKEKKLVETVAQASGSVRVTAKALRTSSTTATILDGRSWETAVPGLIDNQALRKFLSKINANGFPKGLDWEGVQYEMSERESKLPPKSRYIHSVIARGDIKLVVTMDPALAQFIHQVRFLAIDYTFKRVRGEFNEWEVASNIDRYKMRASLASLYCNRATREAFRLLVREFLEVVEIVTGKSLQFHFLNKEARLRCIIFDAEAAQMQGCGDAVLPFNQPDVSGITTKDPLVFVQYFTKTCVQHFLRNIDELPKAIPRDEINRLKSFPGLSSHSQIDEWRERCRSSPHKAVVDWYKQKEMHPWYLPSVNGFLSPMDKNSWTITPHDTNIAETAHAARNKETSINAPLLAAIFEARYRDAAIVQRIEQFEAGGTLGNRWNGPQERERRSASRRDARFKKGQVVRDAQSQYTNLQAEMELLTAKRQSSLADDKTLESQLGDIRKKLDSSIPPSEARILKDQRAALNKEKKEHGEERRAWSKRITEIKEIQKSLKANELKGSHTQDSRPSSSASTPFPESRPLTPSPLGLGGIVTPSSKSPTAGSDTGDEAPMNSDLPFTGDDDLFDDGIPFPLEIDLIGDFGLPSEELVTSSPANPPSIPSTPHRADITAPGMIYSPSLEALLAEYPADPVDEVDWGNLDWDAMFQALQTEKFVQWHSSSVPMGDVDMAQNLHEAGLLITKTLQHDHENLSAAERSLIPANSGEDL